MQLDISVRHGHLSEASQEKLKAKAHKLERIFDRLTAIEIVVDLSDESMPKVDIKADAEHKHDFVAHDQSDNLMKSFEASISKIEQQLRKYKERVQDKHRNQQAKQVDPMAAELESEES